MKTFIIFLLGIAVGAFGYSVYLTPAGDRTKPATENATDLKNNLTEKARQWHLTPEDLKREFSETGKIVREKAGVAGAKITDARIITVIKSKYVLDRDLAASDIKVECTSGRVTLTGSLASLELVSKAFYHAMDTEGVVSVTSNLTSPTP